MSRDKLPTRPDTPESYIGQAVEGRHLHPADPAKRAGFSVVDYRLGDLEKLDRAARQIVDGNPDAFSQPLTRFDHCPACGGNLQDCGGLWICFDCTWTHPKLEGGLGT